MVYLEEFRNQLISRNYTKILQLWQEYCAGDMADREEIVEILKLLKSSEFANVFGTSVEAISPLIEKLTNDDDRFECYRLVIDLQTSNNRPLFDIAHSYLKKRFSNATLFNEKMRLVGLKSSENFQGALSHFILLNHLEKGNFVLHTAGWGVGEIMDVSFLREQATIEFEHLHGGKRDLAFKNAFKTTIPIPKTHFLARRFANPDALEKEAKENPVEVVRQLLHDLGPKTATEIKDEMVDLVIPEQDYSKWWQLARTKLKKDPLIEVPDNIKEPFKLRTGHASWEERLEKALSGKQSCSALLIAAHSLVRDFPEILKTENAKARLIERIKNLLIKDTLSEAEKLQVMLFLENPLGVAFEESSIKDCIVKLHKIPDIIEQIEVIALKKRLLAAILNYRKDWAEIYLQLLFTIEPNQLRDFVLKELMKPSLADQLKQKLQDLIQHPNKHPEAFFWYFQKILEGDAPYFDDEKSRYTAIESLFILFSYLDHKPEFRDLSKKIYALLTGDRFVVVRDILKNSSKEFAEEFLLLASKCHGFTDHDKKILQSLAEVVHSSLIEEKKAHHKDPYTIWTTAEGYQSVQERIKHIGTVEIVDVAKEIEAARAHGDLRENSEYKFALERRNRLQSELKMLSDQFNKARIITKDDVSTKTVGIGSIVDLLGPKGEKVMYTILGPWDADPDKAILSFQSKFAQAMEGKKAGEKFQFKGDEFKVLSIRSFL